MRLCLTELRWASYHKNYRKQTQNLKIRRTTPDEDTTATRSNGIHQPIPFIKDTIVPLSVLAFHIFIFVWNHYVGGVVLVRYVPVFCRLGETGTQVLVLVQRHQNGWFVIGTSTAHMSVDGVEGDAAHTHTDLVVDQAVAPDITPIGSWTGLGDLPLG